jgi:hypothetical protein
MLIGLLVLLAVQLTGLSCLSDFDLHVSQAILLSQSQVNDSVNSLGNGTEDGCPCHLLFQGVSPMFTAVISPSIARLSEAPHLLVSSLSRVLFHPPALT